MASPLSRDAAFAIADPAIASLWILRLPFGANLSDIVAESVTLTSYKTPALPRFNGGSNSYFPGTSDIDGISATFYETHDYRVTKYFRAWRKKIFDPDSGIYGMPNDYKQTLGAELYSNLTIAAVAKMRYVGCWPTDIGAYDMNYTDETARLTVQVQFSVDSITEL